MSLYKWSRTANTNASADPTINWAEGQAPSTINDSARAMMSAAAQYRDDISGQIVTAGTSTGYTLSSFQGFDSFADMDGKVIAFTPHVTNTQGSPSVTLNVDGLGVRAFAVSPGVDLPAGILIAGTPYTAIFNNSLNAFFLHGLFGNPYNIPLGGGLDYWGSTAPNSYFALPQGQAISRTTYAALFSLVGTAYGNGDGSTTFNLPNKQGRVSAMLDGTGTILTSASVSPSGSSLGATGGSQAHTLTLAELPTGITSSGSSNVTAPNGQDFATGVGTEVINYAGGSTSRTIVTSNTITANSSVASGSSSGTSNNTGGGAHIIVQPTIVCNYIMRII